MTVRIIDAPIRGFYGQSLTVRTDAAAATTDVRAYNKRHGYREILFEPQADMRLGLTPLIVGIFHYDSSANTYRDMIGSGKAIIDSGQTNTAPILLDASDFWYIGTNERTRGYYVDMSATVNNNNQALTLGYSALGGFTASAITDGTNSSGALAQDGAIEIDTIPAEGLWRSVNLKQHLNSSNAPSLTAYWVRLTPAAILDAVIIDQVVALTRTTLSNGDQDTAASDMGFFQSGVEYTMDIHDDAGGFEVIAQAAASTTVKVSWIKR